VLTVVLIVLLIFVFVGGGAYRYPAWSSTGWGGPDIVWVLLIVVLVFLLLGRG
jgi:hypothetical protein